MDLFLMQFIQPGAGFMVSALLRVLCNPHSGTWIISCAGHQVWWWWCHHNFIFAKRCHHSAAGSPKTSVLHTGPSSVSLSVCLGLLARLAGAVLRQSEPGHCAKMQRCDLRRKRTESEERSDTTSMEGGFPGSKWTWTLWQLVAKDNESVDPCHLLPSKKKKLEMLIRPLISSDIGFKHLWRSNSFPSKCATKGSATQT